MEAFLLYLAAMAKTALDIVEVLDCLESPGCGLYHERLEEGGNGKFTIADFCPFNIRSKRISCAHCGPAPNSGEDSYSGYVASASLDFHEVIRDLAELGVLESKTSNEWLEQCEQSEMAITKADREKVRAISTLRSIKNGTSIYGMRGMNSIHGPTELELEATMREASETQIREAGKLAKILEAAREKARNAATLQTSIAS